MADDDNASNGRGLLSVGQVAELLNLHPSTVYQKVAEGRIPFTRIGRAVRFDRRVIENWVQRNTIKENPAAGLFLKHDVTLDAFDRQFLKGGSTVSARGLRYWNYGIGGIFNRKTAKGHDRWYMQYKDVDGRWRQEVISHAMTRADAVVALQVKVRDVFNRVHNLKPKHKRIGFPEFSEMYLKDYSKTNKVSWRTDVGALKILDRFFGRFSMDEIGGQLIEQYKTWRLAHFSVTKTTVNRDLALLRKMLNLAVDWGYLDETKVPRFKFYPEKDNLKERILTLDEERRLLKISPPRLRSMIIVALNTGMRLGEILGLRWSQVDLSSARIRVERTKSGRIRFIDMNEVLIKELLRLREGSGGSEFVFSNPGTGRPYVDAGSAWPTACRRAEIKGLRFHDLRHTFATRLVEHGVDLITVKDLLGHSTVEITQRYTHPNQDLKKKAVAALAADVRADESLLNIYDGKLPSDEKKRLSGLISMN
jgi:excisionase family DNA binding protein